LSSDQSFLPNSLPIPRGAEKLEAFYHFALSRSIVG